MSDPTPPNSTNVRFHAAAVALIAAALWCAFVALLAWGGAIATLAGDVPLLSAFACAVALLAYGVDVELRGVLARQHAALLAGAAIVAICLCTLHPSALLAFSPVAAVCVAAATARLRAPRLRSTAAASPGGRRGAL